MLPIRHRFYLYPLSLIASAAAFILLGGAQLSLTAVAILLRQAAILGLLCIGLGFVVLTGGIDLSVGAVLSLGSSICAFVLVHNGNAVLPALCFSVLAGVLCGLCNGLLIAYFHFPAAIVTFAQMLVFSGLAYCCSGWISDRLVSPIFYRMFSGSLCGVPISALCWFLLLALASLALRYTYWGQYLYAIGDNEQALRTIGISTHWYKIMAYVCCGFFASLAGVFMLARVSVATGNVNATLVLEALSAISFGGIGFSGSYGQLPGLLIGTVTIVSLKMCMTIYALPTHLQSLIIAILFFISLFIGRALKTDISDNTT